MNNDAKKQINNLKERINNLENQIMNLKKINLIFRAINDKLKLLSTTELQCEKNEKMKDVIQRYREKSGFINEQLTLIFNATLLKSELTVREYGLYDKAIIIVKAYN